MTEFPYEKPIEERIRDFSRDIYGYYDRILSGEKETTARRLVYKLDDIARSLPPHTYIVWWGDITTSGYSGENFLLGRIKEVRPLGETGKNGYIIVTKGQNFEGINLFENYSKKSRVTSVDVPDGIAVNLTEVEDRWKPFLWLHDSVHLIEKPEFATVMALGEDLPVYFAHRFAIQKMKEAKEHEGISEDVIKQRFIDLCADEDVSGTLREATSILETSENPDTEDYYHAQLTSFTRYPSFLALAEVYDESFTIDHPRINAQKRIREEFKILGYTELFLRTKSLEEIKDAFMRLIK